MMYELLSKQNKIIEQCTNVRLDLFFTHCLLTYEEPIGNSPLFPTSILSYQIVYEGVGNIIHNGNHHPM